MDPMTMMALASAGSGIITKLMNPGGAYKAGQKQLDKFYNQGQGYLQPYSQNGQDQYGNLNGAINNLLNPSQLTDQWMNDYQMSDAAKYQQGRAQDAGMRAMSSMGMVGSTPGLQAMQAGLSGIAADDEQRYIDRMIQQYTQGANLAQGIYGQGAGAAGQMSNNAMNMGQNSAEMAYGQKSAPGAMFGSLMNNASNLGGQYYQMQGMNNLANSMGNSGWNTGG